jgi:hypothetical protein
MSIHTNVVKVKNVDINEFESFQEALVAWWKAQGWDGKMFLNASKFKINREQWTDICQEFIDKFEDGAGSAFMNYGPSGNSPTIYGEAIIEDGWLTNFDNEENE